MNRLDLYKDFKTVSTMIISTDDKEILDIQNKRIQETKKEFSGFNMYASSKELIFDVIDGLPVFYPIQYVLDTTYLEIKVGNVLVSMLADNDDIETEVIETLARAAMAQIPVYPNNESVEEALLNYQKKLLIDGFSMKDENGALKKYKLTNKVASDISEISKIQETITWRNYSPAEMILIKQTILNEIAKYDTAKSIILNLEIAIKRLSAALNTNERNENELQNIITSNPILFGPDYKNIVPKYQFGKDYEADYVLERNSGLIDLVEIESSNLPLFNKNGSPSQYLIHAEQQVLDWLDWVDKNYSYSRNDLENLYSPSAIIIIGRKNQIIKENEARLKRRKIMYRNIMKILTYDDLLEQAENLLKLISNHK